MLQYHEALANHEAHMRLMSAPELMGSSLPEPARSLIQRHGCTQLTREQIAVIQVRVCSALPVGVSVPACALCEHWLCAWAPRGAPGGSLLKWI